MILVASLASLCKNLVAIFLEMFSEASPARQNLSEPFLHVLLKLEAMFDAWLRGKTLTPFNAVKVSKSLRSSIRHESNMSGVPKVFDTLQF